MEYRIEGNGTLFGTPQEVAAVLLVLSGAKQKVVVPAPKRTRKARRFNRTRHCDFPGCTFVGRGLMGIAVHKTQIHGIRPDGSKREVVMKPCPECGKEWPNGRGLGLHRVRAHGVGIK